jgi:mRNA-degrading endonuclease YafQ of YafQ-DinJ toxin-antitoxin module
MLDRARWATQLAAAVDRCKRVIQTVVEASGAHAHFLDHPLQRALRDVNTISCHVVFDLDGRLESFGRLLLGLDSGGALL